MTPQKFRLIASRGMVSLFMSLLSGVAIPDFLTLKQPVSAAEMSNLTLPRKKADQLLEQGRQQYQMSQYQAALQSWQEALRIYREIGDRQGETASLGNLGVVCRNLGQYDKAIEFLQQALTIAREISNHQKEANALNNLAIVHYLLGQYYKAIEYYQQSLNIFQEIGNRQGETNALNNLANTYRTLGQHNKAIELLKESLSIAQDIGSRQGEANAFGSIGLIYYGLGQYDKAIKFQHQYLVIAQEIGDRQGESNSLGNLGLAYFKLGEYDKAIESHQQSLAIEQDIGNPEGEAASLGNLGLVYYRFGQYHKAIKLFQNALTIQRKISDRHGEAISLSSLAITYDNLGQYNKTIKLLQESLVIAQEIGDRNGEANSWGNLGNAYRSLEQYDKAIECHQESLRIKKEIGDRNGEANSLGNLGIIYRNLGQYEKAIDFHQQSLTIDREISDRNGEANSLGNLGNAYRNLGKYHEAIKLYQQALKIAQEISDTQQRAGMLNSLGLAYFDLGELLKAEITLLDGIGFLEYIRRESGGDENKISIFDEQNYAYETLQNVRVALNKTNEALEIAERSRAKALVDLLTARLSDNPENLKVNPLTIQQIQQVAKDKKATLVLYSLIEDEIFTWIIKPTGEVEFKRQKNESDLNELVEIARDSIGVRDRGVIKLVPISESDETQQREKLQQLHQLLIEPIADFLPKNPDEPVIFMPQGALFLVPFPALQDAEGNYLVDKHTILTAPSIQTLQLTQQQRQRVSGEGVLIVGNPTMPRVPKEIGEEAVQLTPLDGAETEAKAIAQFFNTNAMIGSQATKSAVLEQIANARVVHLATHGLLDDFGLGVPGAIALAPDPNFKPEIGEFNSLLTAGEIFDLDLSAELVVLSACNTGRGQIRGEGVIGLSRSLIQAGVPSVLVSLWQVPDAPTAELMVEFYRNLEEKNLDKAQALRQAMLTIKEDYPNPRNWAAFTLIGEAN